MTLRFLLVWGFVAASVLLAYGLVARTWSRQVAREWKELLAAEHEREQWCAAMQTRLAGYTQTGQALASHREHLQRQARLNEQVERGVNQLRQRLEERIRTQQEELNRWAGNRKPPNAVPSLDLANARGELAQGIRQELASLVSAYRAEAETVLEKEADEKTLSQELAGLERRQSDQMGRGDRARLLELQRQLLLATEMERLRGVAEQISGEEAATKALRTAGQEAEKKLREALERQKRDKAEIDEWVAQVRQATQTLIEGDRAALKEALRRAVQNARESLVRAGSEAARNEEATEEAIEQAIRKASESEQAKLREVLNEAAREALQPVVASILRAAETPVKEVILVLATDDLDKIKGLAEALGKGVDASVAVYVLGKDKKKRRWLGRGELLTPGIDQYLSKDFEATFAEALLARLDLTQDKLPVTLVWPSQLNIDSHLDKTGEMPSVTLSKEAKVRMVWVGGKPDATTRWLRNNFHDKINHVPAEEVAKLAEVLRANRERAGEKKDGE
jgi:hypothetical protein